MRKIREVLRLHYENELSPGNIAQSVSIARSTVQEYVRRAKRHDLSWPLPKELNDEALGELLYPPQLSANIDRPMPDFAEIYKELKHKGVTLFLLWEEYSEGLPEAYGYSRFCELYRKWEKKCDVSMTQHHKGGEKLFVDYAGVTVPIWNADGTTYDAQIFVATMGASSYSYVEATESQKLRDWITSHVHAFEDFGGITKVVVPDNLKSAVNKSHRYEPDINLAYADMAAQYGIAVIPARVRTPKDKSKAEKAVQDVERQILAPLRKRKFFSLDELNREIRRLLKKFNEKPFQKMPGSRLSHFEELDKPFLKPLPLTPYEYAEWGKKLVGKSYHINVLGHHYSVPYHYTQEKVDIRITARIVEILCKGKRIASHRRSFEVGKYTTNPNHMPAAHRAYAEISPEKLLEKAENIGPHVAKWVQTVLENGPGHSIQRMKTCSGVLVLTKLFDHRRLDSACKRALHAGLYSCRRLESMLKRGLDQQPIESEKIIQLPQNHENIRGPNYYTNQGDIKC